MYHFIYKTTHISGKYYIGRHSTNNLDDGYFGSGKWIRSLKDKSNLKREIIKFCSIEELAQEEEKLISENIGKPNCMNFNNKSIGFSSGDLNHNSKPENKHILRERILGDKNPAKREDVRKKMSEAHKGKKTGPRGPMSENARKNISEGRTGLKYSEEGRKKLSESRKKHFQEGKIKIPNFNGKSHTEEYKKKMKDYYHNRDLKYCTHCSRNFHPSVFGRWHGEKCKLNSEVRNEQ